MCQSQWCPSERIDYSLCNTTLKPLKTRMHAVLLSLNLFFLQSNQDLLMIMFFFVLCTRLSFNVRSAGAPNENIVQNHLNIALLNVF